MSSWILSRRDERGAATSEYAALTAAVASGTIVIIAIRWALEYHDAIFRFTRLVIDTIMELVGAR